MKDVNVKASYRRSVQKNNIQHLFTFYIFGGQFFPPGEIIIFCLYDWSKVVEPCMNTIFQPARKTTLQMSGL